MPAFTSAGPATRISRQFPCPQAGSVSVAPSLLPAWHAKRPVTPARGRRSAAASADTQAGGRTGRGWPESAVPPGPRHHVAGGGVLGAGCRPRGAARPSPVPGMPFARLRLRRAPVGVRPRTPFPRAATPVEETVMSQPAIPAPPNQTAGFAALGLEPRLVETLATLGYEEPTPI